MRNQPALAFWWLCPILAISAASSAQTALENDPVAVLARVRDQVAAHSRQIPSHTCVETVERDRYEPAAGPPPKSCDALLARRRLANFAARLRLAATDRLRLDVALAGDREMYAWAGARRFEEGEIDALIPDGAMGTGAFANLLLSVFDAPDPEFRFLGPTTRDVSRLFQYSFDIPLEQSQYRAKAGKQWLPTGYTGMLLVDPRTAALVEFMVRTEELPAATGMCEVDSTLDYGAVTLGNVDYLLPVATRQRFLDTDGSEEENRIRFASCREFRAESHAEFGDPPPLPEKAPQKPPALSPPAGLPVTVNLASTVYSDRAAAGDRIEGRLSKPMLDSQRGMLARAGAVLEGRLMRVELRYGKRPETVIALRWETLETNSGKSSVSLIPVHRSGSLKDVGLAVLRSTGTLVEFPRVEEGRYSVYRFPGRWPVIQEGLRTEWTTGEP